MTALTKPTVGHVPHMLALMGPHMRSERLLPRTEQQVIERLRDYTVALDNGAVVGVASLSVVGPDLAEVGALCGQDARVEAQLLDAVLREAEQIGVDRAFVLTDDGSSFEAHGFRPTSLAALPEKRDRQCLRCPRLPRCRQVALEIGLASLREPAIAK